LALNPDVSQSVYNIFVVHDAFTNDYKNGNRVHSSQLKITNEMKI